MTDSLSPEEKLLRLIRGQKKEKSAMEQIPAPLKNRVDLPSNNQKNENNRQLPKILTFSNLKKTLLIIFLSSCGFFIFSLIYPLFLPKEINFQEITGAYSLKGGSALEKDVKSYEFYSTAIKNKNIFISSSSQADSENNPIALGNELMKNINLVGIITGDNPQAVIEDKKSQKTYYVTKNQLIGQFQVEEILEGKIILNSNGQKFELFL